MCFFQDDKQKLFLHKDNKLTQFAPNLPYTEFSQIRASGDIIACIAKAPDRPAAVISIDKEGHWKILSESSHLQFDAENLSSPEAISFESHGRTAYAYFYSPKNKHFEGIPGTKPPLLVMAHGGPTYNCGSAFDLTKQYWLSRGYAIVDVNYGGSSGYGRKFRESLHGELGVINVEDCEAAALFLSKEGKVDPNRLIITGHSAGGYTALAALAFTKTFHAGVSLAGISDCEKFKQETRKSVSRYFDALIGSYPEQREKYRTRSPIHYVDKISSPVILFQGEQDNIVPPNQAKMMHEALLAQGIKTILKMFPDEAHLFTHAENKETILLTQEDFLKEVLALDKPYDVLKLNEESEQTINLTYTPQHDIASRAKPSDLTSFTPCPIPKKTTLFIN